MRRIVALRIVVFGLLAAALATTGSVQAPAASVARLPRILYASDWSGTSQIYEVDPATGRRGQLTFGPAPACMPANPCGYVDPIPSPDGRRVLYSDRSFQGPLRSSLFVARTDGRERRLIRKVDEFGSDPSWSADSRRIVYAGTDGIHVVDADGRRDRLVDRGDDGDPLWSPDGRSLAFILHAAASEELVVARGGKKHVVSTTAPPPDLVFAWSPNSRWLAYSIPNGYGYGPGPGDLDVVHPDGSARHVVASAVGSDFAWSPSGAWLAYSSSDSGDLEIAHPDGSGRRRLLDAFVGDLAWSADGRSLAACCRDGLLVVDVAKGSPQLVPGYSGGFLTWSPRGHVLAYAASDGIRVASGGSTRLITADETYAVAWSPDADSLAYLANGRLRVARLAGTVRTIVEAAGDYGGMIWNFTWTRPSADVHYRQPAGRSLATVSQDQLTAPWPIERIGTDGDRIAYVACGHVFVWTPATKEVVQAEPVASMAPNCQAPSYYTSYRVYDLALAGDRVAFGSVEGGNGRSWWLGGIVLGSAPSVFTLGQGHATNGGPYRPGPVVGELAGAGDLLVFGSWSETFAAGSFSQTVTTAEDIHRVEPGGCPCPAIESSPGPLVPLDIEGGRLVVGGDNETWLLDSAGRRLLTLSVSPLAAQLSGSDLVVLVRGELRDYDASSGALRHAWPLPDVPSGRECATPNGIRCFGAPTLILQDAARGLVTYVLDGQVHVLRLANGTDVTVAAGIRARFTNSGLVYADGASLHLVPFDRLPV